VITGTHHHAQLGKAIIFMNLFYYRENIWVKINKRKRLIRKVLQEKSGSGFQLPFPVELHR
jgi:hypothetical protein